MRRFLHITTFMIAITSCIACESNFDRWVEKASTVNSPVSMTISIPELGIEDAVFESEGYPFLLLGINPWSPYIVLDNDFFEFELKRTLKSKTYPDLEAEIEIRTKSVTRDFELYEKYELRLMDEMRNNDIYISLDIDDSKGVNVYSADVSRDGFIMFIKFTDEDYISGVFECAFSSEDGNATITNGIFTDAPCRVTNYKDDL